MSTLTSSMCQNVPKCTRLSLRFSDRGLKVIRVTFHAEEREPGDKATNVSVVVIVSASSHSFMVSKVYSRCMHITCDSYNLFIVSIPSLNYSQAWGCWLKP